MVIRLHRQRKPLGILLIDAMVAIAIITIAVLPLMFGFHSEIKSLRLSYQHAVAMELVDGELEGLAAGAWRQLPEGSTPWSVHGKSAVNLPKGQFVVTRRGNHLQLKWTPATRCGVGAVVREVVVK